MKNSKPLRQHFVTAAVSLFLLALAPSAMAMSTLLDEDFDTENAGFGGIVNYNNFASFDVISGSVDLIGNGFRDFFPGNGLYVDLDGTTSTGGLLSSKATFSFEPGMIYQLDFDLGNPDQQFGGGSVDNAMTVSLGPAFSETFERDGLSPFETITRDITVDELTLVTLDFQQAGGDNLGILIDNVKLSQFAKPDLNRDGFVDGLDLGILLSNFDQTAMASGGELNGTDPVDGLDLGILLGAWDPPTLPGPVSPVPEPTSLGLLTLGILTLGVRRRT